MKTIQYITTTLAVAALTTFGISAQDLNKEISIIVGEISNLQHQKKELDSIKDGISNEILDKHWVW